MALSGEHNMTLRTLWDLASAVGCRIRIDLVPEVVEIPLTRGETGREKVTDKPIVVAA